jgi:chromosome segregation ATPase
MDNTQILYLAGAFLLGFIIAWFAGRGGPKRAAEEAVAETESVRRKMKSVEGDLRKAQGQVKENLSTLDQMTSDKENLVKMLKASEQGLTDASAELNRLTDALADADAARLLLVTELDQARNALSGARTQVSTLQAEINAIAEAAVEVVEEVESTALAERDETDLLSDRLVELESQLALARATADRLAEKEVLVSAELFLRRREYKDIVAGGEDAVAAALAARDRAITDTQTELDYMRRDLSMLTSAGAQLAAALEQRNSEYSVLVNRVAVDETARLTARALSTTAEEDAGEDAGDESADGPDLAVELAARTAELDELKGEHESLQALLEEAISERNALQQQLEERTSALDGLNGKMAATLAELSAIAAEKDNLVQQVQQRSAIISDMLNKIGAYEAQLRTLVATVAQAPRNGATDTSVDQGEAENGDALPGAQEGEGETHVS